MRAPRTVRASRGGRRNSDQGKIEGIEMVIQDKYFESGQCDRAEVRLELMMLFQPAEVMNVKMHVKYAPSRHVLAQLLLTPLSA